MSRVFRRPMFRKGGGVNMNGIMSGIQDRQNYQEAGAVSPNRVGELTKQNIDLLMQSDEGNKSFDPLTTFLLQYGPAIASARPTGNTLATLVGAAGKPLQSMIEERRAQQKYDRQVRTGATQLAIEQAGKEALLKKELEGRERIEQIKAEGKMDPLYATILEENLKFYPGNPDVAKRATSFQTTLSGNLYNKVGAQAGGVLQFDINDPEQRKSNQKFLKQNLNKVFYDPYTDTYKRIVKEGKALGFKTFSSIEEIDLLDVNITGNDTKKSEPTPGLFGRETKEDVITPKVKSFMESIEEQEGTFGSGA